jgi:hypothetical protein
VIVTTALASTSQSGILDPASALLPQISRPHPGFRDDIDAQINPAVNIPQGRGHFGAVSVEYYAPEEDAPEG